MPASPDPWFTPDWPAPPNVRALFTTRGVAAGDGASAAPRQFFNLGDHVGDAPEAVAANRARLRQGLQGARPVFMNQVHGTAVLCLHAATPDGATADAAVCHQPGLACTVMVADCLPVLITDTQGSAVAAAHAGCAAWPVACWSRLCSLFGRWRPCIKRSMLSIKKQSS